MFISGRIGTKEIAKEDLNSFQSTIKDYEWTNNNLYKQAQIVEVKPSSFIVSDRTNTRNPPENFNRIQEFNKFLIEEYDDHIKDFKSYKSDIENRSVLMSDKILTSKREFLRRFNLADDRNISNYIIDRNDLLDIIKYNKTKIIEHSYLKEKLRRYLDYIRIKENMDKTQFSSSN